MKLKWIETNKTHEQEKELLKIHNVQYSLLVNHKACFKDKSSAYIQQLSLVYVPKMHEVAYGLQRQTQNRCAKHNSREKSSWKRGSHFECCEMGCRIVLEQVPCKITVHPGLNSVTLV